MQVEEATWLWARASVECQKEDVRLKAALLSNQADLQASQSLKAWGKHLCPRLLAGPIKATPAVNLGCSIPACEHSVKRQGLMGGC